MIDIAIAAIANQTLSIQLEERFYEIDLREANGVMSASVKRDDVQIISNVRITAGTPLLPYRYQETGNFIVTTDNDAIPYWDQFGVTQFLTYLSQDEVDALRGA